MGAGGRGTWIGHGLDMDVVKNWRFHLLEILEHLNYRVENGTPYLKRK